MTLEGANMNKEALEAMKVGQASMAKLHKDMDADKGNQCFILKKKSLRCFDNTDERALDLNAPRHILSPTAHLLVTQWKILWTI